MKYHFIVFLKAKILFYFQLLLAKWNDFFDPTQVLEQKHSSSMPDFQIDSFIETAIKDQIPVQVSIQTGDQTEVVAGNLFKDLRHTDTFFMTTPENSKLTRIIFKKQITAVSINGHFNNNKLGSINHNEHTLKLRKTS